MIFISGIRDAHDVFHNSHYSLHTLTFARDDNNIRFGYNFFVLVQAAVPTKKYKFTLIRKEKINPNTFPRPESTIIYWLVSGGVGLVFCTRTDRPTVFPRAIFIYIFFRRQYLNSLSKHGGAEKEERKEDRAFLLYIIDFRYDLEPSKQVASAAVYAQNRRRQSTHVKCRFL